MTATWPTKEVELLAELKLWATGRGATAYEEIEMVKGEAIADLVTESNRKGKPRADVFEGKTSMSAVIIRQAFWWRQFADGVWIVLPKPKGRNPKILRRNIEKRAKYWPVLQELGLGLIELHKTDGGAVKVEVVLHAADADDGRSSQLLGTLNPKYKGTAVAGSAGGTKAGAWGLTRQRLIAAAKERPGTPLKYLVKDFEHHYGSDQEARSKLSRIAKKDGIPGIRITGQELNVYPT